MRVKKVLAMVPILTALLLAGTPTTVKAEDAALFYRLDLNRAREGLVSVIFELDSVSSPLILRMEDSFGGNLAVDLVSHVHDLRAFTASGEELPVKEEGDAWSVEGTGKITVTYKVLVTDYRAGTPYLQSLSEASHPWPYFPLLENDLAYLPGYAVFIRPESPSPIPVNLEVDLPAGWQVAVPWGERPGSLETLLTNPILAGELVLVDHGSFLLALPASSSPSAATLEEFSSRIGAVLAQAGSLPGSGESTDEERLTIFLLLRGEGEGLEDTYYPLESYSNTVLVAAPSGLDVLSDTCLEAVTRGLVSLFLGRSLQLEPESRWLLEGAAWYLQDFLPYKAGIWGAPLFWDRFSTRYQNYRQALSASNLSIARAGDPEIRSGEAAALLACGGASACAAIDSELRAQQAFSGDLVSFLRDLRETGGKERRLGNGDIRSLLESKTGRAWSDFFDRYILGSREIPPSFFSAMKIAPAEPGSLLEQTPSEPVSISDWVLLVIAVVAVLLIPFVMEPYTMQPRKPGFLEKKLRE